MLPVLSEEIAAALWKARDAKRENSSPQSDYHDEHLRQVHHT